MDKTEPRNVTVLIEELKREESSKKEMEKKQSFVGKLSPVKSPDIATVNQVSFVLLRFLCFTQECVQVCGDLVRTRTI